MNIGSVRQYCLTLPQATEGIQWEHALVFKVGGKMFAVVSLNAADGIRFSFKCTAEEFAELTEREGIIPAAYLARYHWVTVTAENAVTTAEMKRLIRDSHAMVSAKLPKSLRQQLGLS